jgi:hypothetical protein
MIELNEAALPGLVRWFIDPAAPQPPGISGDKSMVARECLDRLFLQAPPYTPGPAATQAFDAIIREQFGQSPARRVEYTAPFPKYEFLRYLARERGYLLHGSHRAGLESLEPATQTDWNGRPVQAVFATGDGIWSLFFAVLNRAALQGSIRNGCLVLSDPHAREERYYFFSVNGASLEAGPWTSGTIYAVPRDTFRPASAGLLRFDEWASPIRASVAAAIPVLPTDFPFLSNVTGHSEAESIYTTWLRYKERQPPTRL